MTAVTGTGYLLRSMLRRDRVPLAVWVGALLAFCVYYVTAIGAVYPTAADRLNRAATMMTPGGILGSGPGYGLDDYTPGAMFANEMALWLMVLLATMNILRVTRNTRAEEADGRAELVRALAVGRHAAPVAAFGAVAIADVTFAILGSVLLIGVGGLAVADTAGLMAGLMLTALVFAAVTTVTCQLTVHARGASGLAFAVLGAAVLVRGVGDILEPGGSALSWLSPIAWTQQLRPYVDLRIWPLALSVLAIAALLVLGAVLAARRDLGGSFVHERAGRAAAAPALRGPLALAVRQQRAALGWWLAGCVVMFGVSGAFIGEGAIDNLTAIATQNELTALIFGDDPLGAFLAIMMLHNALAVAVYAVASTLRIRSEEDGGRLGLALARSVTRANVLLSHLVVVAAGSWVLLFLGGALPLWAGATLAGGELDLGTLLTSAGAYALAVSVLIAFTAAIHAWAPRATPLGWVLVGVVVVESFFGVLLGLPDVVDALSPFWWIGDYPSTPLEPSRLLALAAAGVVLLGLALAGFRRRDVTTG